MLYRIPRHLMLISVLFLMLPGAVLSEETSEGAYFEVEARSGAGEERFVIHLLDDKLIQEARNIANGTQTDRVAVMGTIVKAPAYYNRPWSYHVDPQSISFFSMATEVCDASVAYVEEHLDEVGGAFLPNSVWCPWSSKVAREIPAPDGKETSVRVVSAASLQESGVSPGSLISLYGTSISDRTEQAESADFPLELAGVSVEIRQGDDAESRKLPLLFASPSQVNALLPDDISPGLVSLKVNRTGADALEAESYLENRAPGIFFVKHEDNDYAAATILRVRADGSTANETLVKEDPESGQLVPQPVQFGSPDDQLYLSLYGTGLGNAGADAITVRVDSENPTALFAGPQGETPGLNQINIPLAHSLSTKEKVTIQVETRTTGDNRISSNAVDLLVAP